MEKPRWATIGSDPSFRIAYQRPMAVAGPTRRHFTSPHRSPDHSLKIRNPQAFVDLRRHKSSARKTHWRKHRRNGIAAGIPGRLRHILARMDRARVASERARRMQYAPPNTKIRQASVIKTGSTRAPRYHDINISLSQKDHPFSRLREKEARSAG